MIYVYWKASRIEGFVRNAQDRASPRVRLTDRFEYAMHFESSFGAALFVHDNAHKLGTGTAMLMNRMELINLGSQV